MTRNTMKKKPTKEMTKNLNMKKNTMTKNLNMKKNTMMKNTMKRLSLMMKPIPWDGA